MRTSREEISDPGFNVRPKLRPMGLSFWENMDD